MEKVRSTIQVLSQAILDAETGQVIGVVTIAGPSLRRYQQEPFLEDGKLEAFRAERYSGWQGELGQLIHQPDTTLAQIADHAVQHGLDPQGRSGRQEWAENLLNRA